MTGSITTVEGPADLFLFDIAVDASGVEWRGNFAHPWVDPKVAARRVLKHGRFRRSRRAR